jgi:hypothetical protein
MPCFIPHPYAIKLLRIFSLGCGSKKLKKVLAFSRLSLIFPPNPQADQKEHSHGRLGIFKVLARNREPTTICHENEEVYTSDLIAT